MSEESEQPVRAGASGQLGRQRAMTGATMREDETVDRLRATQPLGRIEGKITTENKIDSDSRQPGVYDRIPKRGEVWEHSKTGNMYTVVCVATDVAESTPVVVYERDGRYWTRDLSRFLALEPKNNLAWSDVVPKFQFKCTLPNA